MKVQKAEKAVVQPSGGKTSNSNIPVEQLLQTANSKGFLYPLIVEIWEKSNGYNGEPLDIDKLVLHDASQKGEMSAKSELTEGTFKVKEGTEIGEYIISFKGETKTCKNRSFDFKINAMGELESVTPPLENLKDVTAAKDALITIDHSLYKSSANKLRMFTGINYKEDENVNTRAQVVYDAMKGLMQ